MYFFNISLLFLDIRRVESLHYIAQLMSILGMSQVEFSYTFHIGRHIFSSVGNRHSQST